MAMYNNGDDGQDLYENTKPAAPQAKAAPKGGAQQTYGATIGQQQPAVQQDDIYQNDSVAQAAGKGGIAGGASVRAKVAAVQEAGEFYSNEDEELAAKPAAAFGKKAPVVQQDDIYQNEEAANTAKAAPKSKAGSRPSFLQPQQDDIYQNDDAPASGGPQAMDEEIYQNDDDALPQQKKASAPVRKPVVAQDQETYEDVDQPAPKFAPTAPTPWLHGKLSRDEVAAVFEDNGMKEGLYLVRESTNQPGEYVLSVFNAPRIQHFVIANSVGSYSIDNGPKFKTLAAVVQYYTTHKDQLSVKLITPIVKKAGAPTRGGLSGFSSGAKEPEPGEAYMVTPGAMAGKARPAASPAAATGTGARTDFKSHSKVKGWIDQNEAINNVQLKVQEQPTRALPEGFKADANERADQYKERFNRAALLEEKLYLVWLNKKIASLGKQVEDLSESLKNGIIAIEVLKIVSGQTPPMYSKKPSVMQQQIDNWHVVLKFMSKLGIEVNNVSSGEDLVAVGLDARALYELDRREILKLFSKILMYENKLARM